MEPYYIIRDKKDRLIKKNSEGMLCVFDEEHKAETFLSQCCEESRNDSEIVTRYAKYSANKPTE